MKKKITIELNEEDNTIRHEIKGFSFYEVIGICSALKTEIGYRMLEESHKEKQSKIKNEKNN